MASLFDDVTESSTFGTVPLARNDDPVTSKLAAAEIVTELAALHAWTVQCVTTTPGQTQRELGAMYCPTDPRRIGRRLNEVARLGRIRRGGIRKCTISHRLAETWWPVQG